MNHKITLWAILLGTCSISACKAEPFIGTIPMETLIANPDKYDSKDLYTFGYLRYKGKNTLNFREKSELHNREKDQFNIFMSREYYMAGSFETGIYLQIQDNKLLRKDCASSFVAVSGKFRVMKNLNFRFVSGYQPRVIEVKSIHALLNVPPLGKPPSTENAKLDPMTNKPVFGRINCLVSKAQES